MPDIKIVEIRSCQVLFEINPPAGKKNAHYQKLHYTIYNANKHIVEKESEVHCSKYPHKMLLIKDFNPSTDYKVTFTLFIPGKVYGFYEELQEINLTTLPYHKSFDFEKNQDVESFRKKLIEFDLKQLPVKTPVQKLNILVLGKMGSGKSSTLQTIFSALTNSEVTVATTYTLNEHINKKLTHIPLTPVINLYDIFGETDQIYSQFLERFFDGEITNISLDSNKELCFNKRDVVSPIDESIMSLILVIDYLDTFVEKQMKQFQDLTKLVASRGFSMIVCLTKIDLGIKGDISSKGYYDHYEFVAQVEKVRVKIGIPPDRIFPICNLRSELLNNKYRIKMALDVLYDAVMQTPVRINYYHEHLQKE